MTTTLARPGKQMKWQRIKENITGYLFVLPALLVISVFGLFPILYSVYMSLFDWGANKGPFIGLKNYQDALGNIWGVAQFVAGMFLLAAAYWVWTHAFRSSSNRVLVAGAMAATLLIAAGVIISNGWTAMVATGDQRFLKALPITLYYSIGTVPLQLALGLALAYILFQKVRGQDFFRMIYFLPYITPVVATAVVFRNIFNPRETSLANQVLAVFNLPPQKWLFEPRSFLTAFFGVKIDGFLAGPSEALVSIILFGVWTFVGYNVVVFLAGLGSIPREVYEAAEIDGASQWLMFRHVTIPLISPVTFYLALVSFIGTFKAFNHIFVMRTPSAQGTADVAAITIFDTFYSLRYYGDATAQAIILFIIIAALTYLQNKLMGEKVFYG